MLSIWLRRVGALPLEDNISGGTIVTLSTRRSKDAHIQTLPTQKESEELPVNQNQPDNSEYS